MCYWMALDCQEIKELLTYLLLTNDINGCLQRQWWMTSGSGHDNQEAGDRQKHLRHRTRKRSSIVSNPQRRR